MPSEVFEDAIDLQIGLLQADLQSPLLGATWPGYPFPCLTATGDEEMRRFRTILLENDFLRVTVLPGMGGRILSIWDKRTGTECLQRYPSLVPQATGPRGAEIREGIQFRFLADEDRLNALGNVDSAPEPGEDDESPAGVWIAETSSGTGLSFHLHLTLPPDRAVLDMEVRAFNRTFAPVPYNGTLALHLGEGPVVAWPDGAALLADGRGTGIAVQWSGEAMDGVRVERGTVLVSRFDGTGELAPRQLDTFRLCLIPVSGLASLAAVSEHGAVEVGDSLRIQVTDMKPGHKILLVNEDGQTLEAPADLHPEHVLEIPLGELRPRTIVLRDAGKNELLRWDAGSPVGPTGGSHQTDSPTAVATVIGASSSEEELRRAARHVETRYLAHTLLGYRALAAQRWGEASDEFERALLYNADDHLVWWAKAVAERLRGEGDEERPELLNAHYLAPLEPALRAEAFLSQSPAQGKEPSPLLNALEENPENFIEVAALLIEAGLLADAARWIDEALRHRDLGMLRLLYAYALLTGSRMRVEAAEHVAAAKGLSEPPYPYRSVEWRAIEALREASLGIGVSSSIP